MLQPWDGMNMLLCKWWRLGGGGLGPLVKGLGQNRRPWIVMDFADRKEGGQALQPCQMEWPGFCVNVEGWGPVGWG